MQIFAVFGTELAMEVGDFRVIFMRVIDPPVIVFPCKFAYGLALVAVIFDARAKVYDIAAYPLLEVIPPVVKDDKRSRIMRIGRKGLAPVAAPVHGKAQNVPCVFED